VKAELEALRALDADALLDRYEALFGRSPRSTNREYVFRRVAWRMQELRFGGLSTVARRRLDELVAELDLPKVPPKKAVKPGAVLTREWRGRSISVTVRDEGVEFEGVMFKSLSAVAKHVTGAHWSGRLFFGLKGRSK
jgi:hypothetical protein